MCWRRNEWRHLTLFGSVDEISEAASSWMCSTKNPIWKVWREKNLKCILITCMWDSFGKNMQRRLSWAAIAKWCLLCWRLRCHYCQPFPRACRSISLFHMFHLFLQNISFWISLHRYLYINISSWSWGGLLILLPSHFKPQIQLWDYSIPPSPPWDTSSQKLKISNLPNGQLALF